VETYVAYIGVVHVKRTSLPGTVSLKTITTFPKLMQGNVIGYRPIYMFIFHEYLKKTPQIPFPEQECKEEKSSPDFFTPLKKTVP